MTRFIYISDTHVGAPGEGYHQQSCYADRLPELLHHLDTWIQHNAGVDFVLHGGDMVDQVSVASVRTAGTLFTLSVPVYLCLGNHDMTHLNALDIWLREAPDFFPQGTLDYTINCDGAKIHVLPNHWCEKPVYWDWGELRAHFRDEQLRFLKTVTASAIAESHVLCTHSEITAVPTAQTGFTEPFHRPYQPFVETVTAWVQQMPHLRCVLSGHNHINTCVAINESGARAITASGFSETPFEFKVIDLEPGRLAMRTENLFTSCEFTADYDFDKTFVQGRLKDRAFELYWEAGGTEND